MNMRSIFTLSILLLMFSSIALLSQERETRASTVDGTPLAPDGTPLYSTFSLCAIDPQTGECGAIVTTRVTFVGRRVPYVKAGVGAVATQSWTVIEYGPKGLELMALGIPPEEAIKQMMADDKQPERRQVGLIDMSGRTAAFTGDGCSPWAGSRQGKNYTVQGNLLVGEEVIDAVADHFEMTEGTSMPLAERMILALEVGQRMGGDARWGRMQSAALRVADPNIPGPAKDNITWSIDVGEHQTPVQELKRIYYKVTGTLGYRNFSRIEGNDVIELKKKLHLLGYWREELDQFPEMPEFNVDENLQTTDPEAYEKAIEKYWQLRREYWRAYAIYDDETIAAVDEFRKDHNLDYSGNAAGLVDERFITQLNGQIIAIQKAEELTKD